MPSKLKILTWIAVIMVIFSFSKGDPAPVVPAIPQELPSPTSATEVVEEKIIIRELWVNRTIDIINQINVTNTTIKTITVYEAMDMTPHQQQSLMNMKPDVCFTAGCSDGFDKCKREALGILELKGPKFRETFGTGYNPFHKVNDTLACLERELDGSVVFDGDYWYVTIPFNFSYINETAVRNGTLKIFRDQIKLRRIE